jgi:hypothetical protein
MGRADGAAGLPVVAVALDDGRDVLGADAMKVQVKATGRSRVGAAVSSGTFRPCSSSGRANGAAKTSENSARGNCPAGRAVLGGVKP